jgi:hypothetical protein
MKQKNALNAGVALNASYGKKDDNIKRSTGISGLALPH